MLFGISVIKVSTSVWSNVFFFFKNIIYFPGNNFRATLLPDQCHYVHTHVRCRRGYCRETFDLYVTSLPSFFHRLCM